MAIDVSGSMAEVVPESGATKLELAKQAAIRSIDQFAPDDEVGLWVFASDLSGGGRPFSELVPVSPVGTAATELKQKIASLVPRGGTPLYVTTQAATQKLAEGLDHTRINGVILLTDGHNEYPDGIDLPELLEELQARREDDTVRVFSIAYGKEADLNALKRIAEASRAAVYDAADPTSIDKVFTHVVSNF
jgi:Ca-activated chloride channel family protein